MAVVVPPHVFRQIQRQSFFSHAAFGGELAFQIAPETFQTIDVRPASHVLALAVVDQTVHVTVCRNARVRLPRVAVDDGTAFHAVRN